MEIVIIIMIVVPIIMIVPIRRQTIKIRIKVD